MVLIPKHCDCDFFSDVFNECFPSVGADDEDEVLRNDTRAPSIETQANQAPIKVKPVGLVQGRIPAILAQPLSVRSTLASWLPEKFQDTDLDLIYSTNEHGRSLISLYHECRNSKPTFVLVEVLKTGDVIGMFATDSWSRQPGFYGDGGCFLFSLDPDEKCYRWDKIDYESLDSIRNDTLQEQFMAGTSKYMSMGGNRDGTSGLRLNHDLSRGESSLALGFWNEPLAGKSLPEFEIGVVEVYRLVRTYRPKKNDKSLLSESFQIMNQLCVMGVSNIPCSAISSSSFASPHKPKRLGLIQGRMSPILAQSRSVRSTLASWLPDKYQHTQLDLIFSSEEHGRSLTTLYHKCRHIKPTFVLVEVVQTGGVIGMFATESWKVQRGFYGDEECFLFSLKPETKCYNWDKSDAESLDQIRNDTIQEQLMAGTNKYIAMGGNRDGTSGLRLNKDLTKGESSLALGFWNEPLAGKSLQEFEVGVVEVYRLVSK